MGFIAEWRFFSEWHWVRHTLFDSMQNPACAINVGTARGNHASGAALKGRHQLSSLCARGQNQIDNNLGPGLEFRQLAPITEDVFGRQVRPRFSSMEHGNGMAYRRELTYKVRADKARAADHQHIHSPSLLNCADLG